MHELTADQDAFTKANAVNLLGFVFPYIPDKQEVWEDLHRLANDKDEFVRSAVADSIRNIFQYIENKTKQN